MAGQQTNGHSANGASRYVARGASGIGIHDYAPELGYREYWYPGVEDKRIGRRPVALEEDLPVEFFDPEVSIQS